MEPMQNLFCPSWTVYDGLKDNLPPDPILQTPSPAEMEQASAMPSGGRRRTSQQRTGPNPEVQQNFAIATTAGACASVSTSTNAASSTSTIEEDPRIKNLLKKARSTESTSLKVNAQQLWITFKGQKCQPLCQIKVPTVINGSEFEIKITKKEIFSLNSNSLEFLRQRTVWPVRDVLNGLIVIAQKECQKMKLELHGDKTISFRIASDVFVPADVEIRKTLVPEGKVAFVFPEKCQSNKLGDILDNLEAATKISNPGREEYKLTTRHPKKMYELLVCKSTRNYSFIYWSDLQMPNVFYKVTKRPGSLQSLDKFCKECETRELPLPENLETVQIDFTPEFLNEALKSLATANH
eukprot:GHVP01016208.1.p1 GENE.GHVP01016208.1~~GHVP01016208.1.p1  ORF type:complete len:352 (-),score=36.58 GHVP01016208.1:76-1131(-)